MPGNGHTHVIALPQNLIQYCKVNIKIKNEKKKIELMFKIFNFRKKKKMRKLTNLASAKYLLDC